MNRTGQPPTVPASVPGNEEGLSECDIQAGLEADIQVLWHQAFLKQKDLEFLKRAANVGLSSVLGLMLKDPMFDHLRQARAGRVWGRLQARWKPRVGEEVGNALILAAQKGHEAAMAELMPLCDVPAVFESAVMRTLAWTLNEDLWAALDRLHPYAPEAQVLDLLDRAPADALPVARARLLGQRLAEAMPPLAPPAILSLLNQRSAAGISDTERRGRTTGAGRTR